MEVIWFMLFSTFETLAIYSLIMTLLRFKTTEYIGQALIVMILANLQSFIMRNELQLDFLAPLITVLIFVSYFQPLLRSRLSGRRSAPFWLYVLCVNSNGISDNDIRIDRLHSDRSCQWLYSSNPLRCDRTIDILDYVQVWYWV